MYEVLPEDERVYKDMLDITKEYEYFLIICCYRPGRPDYIPLVLCDNEDNGFNLACDEARNIIPEGHILTSLSGNVWQNDDRYKPKFMYHGGALSGLK